MKRRMIGSILAVLMICAVMFATVLAVSAESDLPKVGVATAVAMPVTDAACGNISGDVSADFVVRADGATVGSEQETEETGEARQPKGPKRIVTISDIASVLSEGSLTIICTVAAAVVFGVGGFLIGRKQRK